ncbi:hypothetical protein AAF712_007008 [Marasmius tenuissimus]|uniref:RRM domain-containing protein n=1 Tax=Marasmius tenuissimus TaxID=585030 RepID=A0ABR2ZYZ4_9AGAR
MTTTVLSSEHGRILCIADIRGHLSTLNDLARDVNAVAIIHTGDFGFFGQVKLNIPVYTVWGACEDVQILEKFRMGTYTVPNLHILDEAQSGTHLLELAGLKLRLFGLGGALVPHKMFDNGDANATIAGGQGTMWTTALQIGQLVDTAQRAFDPSETRLLVTHASPGREGIIAQLALVLKADLTISAGLHFRYATSYNEFSVTSDYEGFRHKLTQGKEQFDKVWESVKTQVDAVIDEHQKVLLDKALYVVERIPPPVGAPVASAQGAQIQAQDEPAWKNTWNWNLCDAAYGSLILDIREGRVSAELKSQGFNYAYRRSAVSQAPPAPVNATPTRSSPALNVNARPQDKVVTGGTSTPTSTSAPNVNVKPNPAQSPKALPPHLTTGAGSRGGSGRGSPAHANNSAAQPAAGEASASPVSSPATQTPTTAHPQSPTVANGAAGGGADAKAERERQKREKKKEKKAERAAAAAAEKEKDKEGKEGGGAEETRTSTPASQPRGHKPQASTGSGAGGDEAKSPATDGARTPRGNKPARNPWTIFLRLTVSTTDADLREFFGEAKSGITKISFPSTTQAGRSQKLAYVEFGDEEAMKLAFSSHAEKLNDAVPELKQATDRETRDREPAAGLTGGGRGRGGSGGQQNQAPASESPAA